MLPQLSTEALKDLGLLLGDIEGIIIISGIISLNIAYAEFIEIIKKKTYKWNPT